MTMPNAEEMVTVDARRAASGSRGGIADLRDLGAARADLVATLKAQPADQQARMFLFQLLCVDGEWDKARTQLDILAAQSPEAQMLAAAYRQSIEAERDGTAGEGAVLLAGESGWVRAFLAASGGDGAARTKVLDQAPDTPGDIDGTPFDLLFDGDTRFGPTIEAIVGGRRGRIPFAAIEEIRSEGPVDLRDLVWLPTEIRLRDGGGLAALLPVRYPGTEREADEALRLARRTEWRESDGAVHGIGQHVWTTSSGDDVPILSFRRIRFAS